jgi:hypothetical protein
MVLEDQQDIKDPIEGRKYLEKHSLLCPPGEPPTHSSLAACLYQISAMAGIQKPAINAIRSVAFLLEEMEETQINFTVKEAIDSQITEFTYDMKTLIEDAKEKINDHLKIVEDRLSTLPVNPPPQPTQPTQLTHTPGSYASALINPPAHANPKIAAREGIRARQFLIEGIKNSKFSHLDQIQLTTELNKILAEAGLPKGKIRSTVGVRNGGTLIEMDSDEAATWLLRDDNQLKLCNKIGPNIVFKTRVYNVIAFNVSLTINPDDERHRIEICEANGLESNVISSIKWAKPVNKRSPSQRTAHLLVTFTNADAANRVITNSMTICNRRCHAEKVKREPTRCLKCQGWNHFAKDCIEKEDKCGNCAGTHRTNDCNTHSNKRCVSCKSNDHASWERICPTFVRKQEELDARNPDNTLQYFPTADPWTWITSGKPATQPTPRSTPSNSSKQLQPSKKPQQTRRQCDTYIPEYSAPQAQLRTMDTYIPNLDWGSDAGPSNARDNRPAPQANTNATTTNTNNSILIRPHNGPSIIH